MPGYGLTSDTRGELNFAVRRCRPLTMLLASLHVIRPITGVSVLVVEQTSDAQLFSGSSVPACPVPGARRFVTEDAVQPVAVFR
jgi:hypothetical protein